MYYKFKLRTNSFEIFFDIFNKFSANYKRGLSHLKMSVEVKVFVRKWNQVYKNETMFEYLYLFHSLLAYSF